VFMKACVMMGLITRNIPLDREYLRLDRWLALVSDIFSMGVWKGVCYHLLGTANMKTVQM